MLPTISLHGQTATIRRFLEIITEKPAFAGAFISYINSDYPAQLGTYGTGGTQGGGTVDPDPVDPDPDPNPVDPGPVTPTGDTFTITLDSFDLTEGYGLRRGPRAA